MKHDDMNSSFLVTRKKTKKRDDKYVIVACSALLIHVLVASTAFASSAGMPWETPLNQLLDSLTGPVSRVIGAVSIIGLGIGIAFSDGGGMMRKALWVVMGLAIAFNAISWGLGFMGFGGGLLV